MKFRHLEYFIAAAEESNFTHAADRLSLLKEEPFISLEPHVSELRRLALESLPACSALAFVAAGFGVAAVSEPLRRIPAKLVCGVNSDALVNRYARKSPATSSQWWVVVRKRSISGEGTEARNYVEEFFFDGVLALEGRMKLSAIFKATIGASATF